MPMHNHGASFLTHRWKVLCLLVCLIALTGTLPATHAHTSSQHPQPHALPTSTPATPDHPPQPFVQHFSDAYLTLEETEQFLREVSASYPNLTNLVDIGNSWTYEQTRGAAGHDIFALRITNQATRGPKPVLFVMAAIHAREVVSTEIAVRFITFLLTNYGVDPTVTWILNEHEIVVVPIANPDGYIYAEQGYLQRKNVNDRHDGHCTYPPTLKNHAGVDLNRNFSFQWGTVDQPTLDPCSQTFPGSSAASEPETRAMQQFITSLYPHPSPPGEEQAAPATTSGLLISLHTYSELVLWPWGYTPKSSPNAEALAQLGQKFADRNGYTPRQAAHFYPSSGTIDDWAYGTLGIPVYTFEIGPATGPCGGFMPAYRCLEEDEDEPGFWPRNLPALLYAAQVVRAPYTQPSGPAIEHIDVVSDTHTITYTVEVNGGTQPVSATEIYLGRSPWHGGTPLELAPLDGTFDSASEQAQITLPLQRVMTETAELTPSHRLVLARGRSGEGVWGPVRAEWMVQQPRPAETEQGPTIEQMSIISDSLSLTILVSLDGVNHNISTAELFIGSHENTPPVAMQPRDGAFDSPDEHATLVLPVSRIRAAGYNIYQEPVRLIVRAKNDHNIWGASSSTWVMVEQPAQGSPFSLWLPLVTTSDDNLRQKVATCLRNKTACSVVMRVSAGARYTRTPAQSPILSVR